MIVKGHLHNGNGGDHGDDNYDGGHIGGGTIGKSRLPNMFVKGPTPLSYPHIREHNGVFSLSKSNRTHNKS